MLTRKNAFDTSSIQYLLPEMQEIQMNTITTNIASLTAYNALNLQSNAAKNIMAELAGGNKALHKGAGSSSYVRAVKAMSATSSLSATLNGVNNAISLVRSVDSTASNILDQLLFMQHLSVTVSDTQQRGWVGDQGFVCRGMFQAQEAIRNAAESFTWNGQNFMIGGAQNNQNTTARNVQVRTGVNTSDNLTMVFKSFHPMSAIDTNGRYSATVGAPNLPNLNATAGTDTHAYGDAAMYYGTNVGQYLHTDTPAITDHTLVQLDRAITGVLAERSRLSAYISRLGSIAESTISAKLSTKNAKAQITDADYAVQTSALAKNQILRKASTALLAQSNRLPAGILELLQ